MIQDIFPHRFNNDYIPGKTIDEDNFILHFKGAELLLKAMGDELELPKRTDFPQIPDAIEYIFLFTFNEIPCFLILESLNVDNPLMVYKEINFFRTIKQQEIAWVSIVGFHLMNWYTQNKYCGKCGEKTEHKEDERALICHGCNSIVFPKISPAIIVAIVCDNKILLARNSRFPMNWYSLVAGFVDVGESLEEALIREVKEEVGLDVKNIRYYKSQPWPLSGSMMIGFVAEADATQPVSIDNKEITEAAWFIRGNLPNYPPTLSIAGEMIEMFEKGEL